MLGLCPQPSMFELCSEPRPSMLELCSEPRPSMLEQCSEPRSQMLGLCPQSLMLELCSELRSSMLELCSEQRPSMLVQYSKPKAIITCTFCKKPGHDAQRCWDIAENQLAQAAKMKSDAEDILQSTHGHQKDLKAFMGGFAASASLACFRGVAPTSNSGEKGSRCGNCQ